MPRRYKKKKVYRKRRTYRKRGYKSLVSNYVPSGISTTRVANLRYVETIQLSSSAGTLDSHAFSANSIHDPNVTGIGHQPMGHDTWASLYNHYVVLGSKVTIRIAPGNIKSSSMVGVLLTDASTPPYTEASTFQEARKGSVRLIAEEQGKAVILSSKFSAKRFFNVKDVKDNVQRLGADSNVSPTEQAYYIVWAQSQTATFSANYTCVVQIDYIVAYSEPKDLQES